MTSIVEFRSETAVKWTAEILSSHRSNVHGHTSAHLPRYPRISIIVNASSKNRSAPVPGARRGIAS